MCAPCSEPGNLRFGNQKNKNSYLVFINNHQKPDLPHFRVWQAKIKQLFKKANPVGQVKLSQWHSKIFIKWGLMEFRWANPNNTLLTFSMSLDSCPQCRRGGTGQRSRPGSDRCLGEPLQSLTRIWFEHPLVLGGQDRCCCNSFFIHLYSPCVIINTFPNTHGHVSSQVQDLIGIPKLPYASVWPLTVQSMPVSLCYSSNRWKLIVLLCSEFL